MYKIIDIKHKNTGKTREDGRYPLRIGSVIDFFAYEPTVNQCAMLSYVSDNKGNPKQGTLRTSFVEEIFEDDNELILTTNNSIYILEKIKNEKE